MFKILVIIHDSNTSSMAVIEYENRGVAEIAHEKLLKAATISMKVVKLW